MTTVWVDDYTGDTVITCNECKSELRIPSYQRQSSVPDFYMCDECLVAEQKSRTRKIDQFLLLREAGQVRRMHTIPHLGYYDVAQHCYGMVALLMTLHPSPTIALVIEIMTHDLAERFLGDTPAPAKWHCKELATEIAMEEDSIIKNLGYNNAELLSDEDRSWLRALDRLELRIQCEHELHLGNRYAESILQKLSEWFDKNREEIPERVVAFWSEYKHKRMPEDYHVSIRH